MPAPDQPHHSWVTRHPNGLEPGDVIKLELPSPGGQLATATARAVPHHPHDPRLIGSATLGPIALPQIVVRYEVQPGEPVVVTCTVPVLGVTDSRENPYEPWKDPA
jgi:hypothetical protein